jgi:hypothetical protein
MKNSHDGYIDNPGERTGRSENACKSRNLVKDESPYMANGT